MPPIPPEVFSSRFIYRGAGALPNLGLTPLSPSSYFQFKENFENLDDFVHLSHSIKFEYTLKILAKTRIGSEVMFKEFQCFEVEVYLAIVVSIAIISCVKSLYKNSLRSWLSTFWAYMSALVSEYHSYPDKTLIDRLISCPWLIGCVIIEAGFAGMLRDQILKGEDIHWIDSLRDLYEWKDITKLQYTEFSEFHNYLMEENNNDTMRDYFYSKTKQCYTLNIRPTSHSNCEQTTELDYQGVLDGTTAMVFQSRYIDVVEQVLNKIGWNKEYNYNVLEKDAHSRPLFTMANRMNFDKQYEEAWDKS